MITIFTYHLSTNRHRQKSILTKIIQLWFSMIFVKQWWRLTVSCWGRIVIRILILIHDIDCISKLLIHSNIKRVVFLILQKYVCKTCMNSSSDGDRSRCDVRSNDSSTRSLQIQCHIADLSSMPSIRHEKNWYYQNCGTIINEHYIT